MEQKNVLIGVLGVGLGLGLAMGGSQTLQKLTTLRSSVNYQELMELELTSQVVDGKSCNVTFDEFPYHLSEQIKELLTSNAFVYLKQEQFSKYTRNLSRASRAILLSGFAEPYPQTLAKALSHHFAAKLLLLDANDFCLKLQRKHDGGTYSNLKSFSETALNWMNSFLENFSILPGRAEPNNCNTGTSSLQNSKSVLATESDSSRFGSSPTPKNQTSLNRANSWAFDDKLLVQSLYKVLVSVSRTSPVILYLRDVEKLIFRGPKTYLLFCKMIKQLSGPILILGSRILDSDEQSCGENSEKMSLLFQSNIDIKPPEDITLLESCKSKLEEDMKAIQLQDNRNHVSEVLAANDIECDDLGSICFGDTMLLSKYIEEIAISAIAHHLKNMEPNYHGGRLIISSQSLSHGLNIFRAGELGSKDTLQMESNRETPQDPTSGKFEAEIESSTDDECDGEETDTSSIGDAFKKKADNTKYGNPPAAPPKPEMALDNYFEKKLSQEVILAGKIGVKFDDIGSLENVKEKLVELVMLPLQRPGLFKGELLKPCRGILLFGPPGTGKTMLAKALATEANASFINVSMSTITSKFFGEAEKYVRALFSLAAKIAPTVIFIDEVDSMLCRRCGGCEHEVMRTIKNEFMAHWDGLLSKPTERVLVLAATNRPFDLDEAIIRRFERRIMVKLPNTENREKILRTILAKENIEEGFDFKELAIMTEGYTGSDLKNICRAAAYHPVRELLKKEKERDKAKEENMEKRKGEKGESSSSEQPSKDDEETESSEKPSKDGEYTKSTEKPSTDGEETKSSEQPNKDGQETNFSEQPSKEGEETKDEEKDETEEPAIKLRPLTMEDLREEKKRISPSFSSEDAVMKQLEEWNKLYGEGGRM